MYVKPNRELQTLAEFDLGNERFALSDDVARYASAATLAELVLRFSPEEPHPEIFVLLGALLDSLAAVDAARLPVVSLASLWAIVGALGFAPALDYCPIDGRPVQEGEADFSVIDGGLVCSGCSGARETARLGAEDRHVLERLVRAGEVSGGTAELGLAPRHAAAHRRLLCRFVRLHVAEGRELKALSFWEGMPWRATS